MSTVNVDLYALWQRDRFVTSLTNSATPALPAIVAGDTWNISLYFVDDTLPLRIHRFAGADVAARLRAVGNANHIYAYGDNNYVGSEIAPASTPPVVAQVQNGTGVSAGVEEIQTITFPSTPTSGTFTITFPSDSSTRGWGPVGSTAPIPATANSAQITDAINSCAFTSHSSAASRADVVATRSGNVITINYTNNGDKPLCTVNVSDLQYKFGWALTVAFTAADFTDYLLTSSGPAFFEVLLNSNQAAFVQLTASPGGGNTPSFTNGPPPNSGATDSFYDFSYSASGFPTPTFSLTSGVLPSGLTLTAGGRISGTPSSAGTFNGVVTASNSAGTATQAFSITISGGTGGGGPGPGGPGLLASYRNGIFTILDYSDGPYLEDRSDEWPGLQIWHIPYCIDIDQYLATKPAVGSFEAPFGYFWKDTPFKYIADGVVEFERLRHNLPGDANQKVSVSKNYQVALYTPQANGSGISDQAIVSFSRDIEATVTYHYALDDPGGLPVIPFIQMIPYLRQQSIWDFGTGFPRATWNGIPNLPDNNYAASNLPGGSVDRVLGRLFCRKTLFG